MASSEAQLNDIKEQELDIFEDLSGASNTIEDEPAFRRNFRLARLKAKQQLALSDDSPFAHLDEEDLSGSQQFRAALLRRETSQIREQLNFVKQRLQEIRSGQYRDRAETSTTRAKNGVEEQQTAIGPNKRITSKEKNTRPLAETKYRPLTGKTDCPNCACDTRRRSICDLCQKINSTTSLGGQRATMQKEPTQKCYVDYSNDYDNRPIRPAKDRTLARVEVSDPTVSGQPLRETVDDVVVPGKVYTISKSLNDKRTKLAQAIDELQRMMEQVKAKSNKLEEERKLVQLYKDQWKYGPSIGGPKSSSRERLGLGNQENRNYESRLDANLARDSKSVMGFKHIEPSLKLRQYNNTPGVTRKGPTKKVQALISKPITSGVSARSKSLESLRQVQKGRIPPHVVINENFQNGKASSEINLRKINEDSEEDEVEEKIEDSMDVEVAEEEEENQILHKEDPPKQINDEPVNEKSSARGDEAELASSKVARMSWIPVFGETEIKTVKKPATRKVQIMKLPPQSDDSTPRTASKAPPLNRYQSQRTSTIIGNKIKRVTITSPSSNQPTRNDRVIKEANRKLRFASNLLEQEKNDCQSKNQLLISKQTRSTPIYISREPAMDQSTQNSSHPMSQKQSTETEQTNRSGDEMSESSRNELARIEEMVNEQQKLLNRLAQLQERQQVISPVTVTCPSPCCMMHGGAHTSTCVNPQKVARGRAPVKRSLLVSTLKDRLNKGKLQLARTLEQERQKHQQLKLRVDSSLRKQSDLQHENELLKQSLSKCIDTCLKDISSTFESLTDTLTESAIGLDPDGGDSTNQQDRRVAISSSEDLVSSESSQVSALSQAAQFITDNKYLKQLKNHIESMELQRKTIFEELKREKQRSLQLETRLKESHSEMDQLDEIKRRLEKELKSVEMKNRLETELEPTPGCSKDSQPDIDQLERTEPVKEINALSRLESKRTQEKPPTSQETETLDQPSSLEFDNSQTSVELYRKFIESMSPDIESLREERKLILNEFDSIKKMLSVIDQ